jgi:serine/threonine-protein kinase
MPTGQNTVFVGHRGGATSAHSRARSRAVPQELVAKSVGRLKSLALVYAATFAAASFGGAAAMGWLDIMVTRFSYLAPTLLSIAMALTVAAVVHLALLSTKRILQMGLAFLVVSSYGIAFAEFWFMFEWIEWSPERLMDFGLSWVAPWIMLFSVVVPNTPRRTAVAALLSGSAPSVVLSAAAWSHGEELGAFSLLFGAAIFPYLLIAVMAYFASAIIYSLGKAVARAQELGSYRLESKIGEGGMGEVWRAAHRMLARPAAVKLIRVEALMGSFENAEQARSRFEREAQATAMLRSPHTVELYDYGRGDDGTVYFVMEYLDGLDLEQLVGRHGAQPPARVVHLLSQACRSLAEAHDQGFFHRDIKPGNLFVTNLGSSWDFLKVMDFGVVKKQDAGDAEDGKLTAEGVMTGTPAYIAPEQVLAKSDLDHRADLYSLGCVAFWMLTGRLLFPLANSMQMLFAHVNQPPPAPSEVAEQAIPASLDAVVLRCLAKAPEDRFSSAEELRLALEGCALGSSWGDEDARAWWQSMAGGSPAPVVGRSDSLGPSAEPAGEADALAKPL